MDELEAHLEEIGKKLDRLRALYESFFMGVDRAPPVVPRQDLNRIFVQMQQETIKNSMQRFRYQQLSQRWVMLTTYWNRTMREIEAGTFRRDIEKAQRRMMAKGGEMSEQEAIALGIPTNRVKAFLNRQKLLRGKADSGAPAPESSAEPKTASAAPATPATPEKTVVPGVSDHEVAEFFRRYMDAHALTGNTLPTVTLDQMKVRLARELPKVLAEKNCTRVDLQVVVEGGKVRMRAKPIK